MFPEIKTNRVLIFDVETNGLLPRDIKMCPQNIQHFPHILQLSYSIYDIEKQNLIKTFDTYIKVLSSVEISPKITELTKITRKKCSKGMYITNALNEFYNDYIHCDQIIAHNLNFDKQMILVELCRNHLSISKSMPCLFTLFNNTYLHKYNIETFCTMKNGIELCNIEVPSKDGSGKVYKKWPKLNELYSHLFTTPVPDGLHNSRVDTLVCLRCYLNMRHNIQITDEIFDKIIRNM